MIKTTIKLNTIKDVQEFVGKTTKIGSRTELRSTDRFIINAKSIMGVFSLDLSKPIEFIIYNNDNKLLENFNKWIIKGE